MQSKQQSLTVSIRNDVISISKIKEILEFTYVLLWFLRIE